MDSNGERERLCIRSYKVAPSLLNNKSLDIPVEEAEDSSYDDSQPSSFRFLRCIRWTMAQNRQGSCPLELMIRRLLVIGPVDF